MFNASTPCGRGQPAGNMTRDGETVEDPTKEKELHKSVSEKILLRVSEAAEALSLSRSKVYEMIGQGQIPAIRMGGVLRIPIMRLKALIEEVQPVEAAASA